MAATLVATYTSAFNGTWPKTLSVTTAVGDVLVAVAAAGEWGGSSDDFATPTGGTGLNWILKQSHQLTLNSVLYEWTATATTAETFTYSVNTAGGTGPGFTQVTRWSGVTVGATSKGNATNAPSLNLVTTASGSPIVAYFIDWNEGSITGRVWRTINGITPSSGAGTELAATNVGGAATFFGARWTNAGAAGTKATGMSTPSQKWVGVTVELVPSGTPVGQVSETDTAQKLAKRKLMTEPSETDTSQHMGKGKSIGENTSTMTAQPITRVKRKLLGQAEESNAAQRLGTVLFGTVHQISETDTVQAITREKSKILGQPSETDTAQAVTAVGQVVLQIATETDLSQPLTKIHRKLVAQAAPEVDEASALLAEDVIPIGMAMGDAEFAFAIRITRIRTIGMAVENDTTIELVTSQIGSVFTVSESEVAQPINVFSRLFVGTTIEIDTVNEITPVRQRQLSIASEVDSGTQGVFPSIQRVKSRTLGQAVETDTPQPIRAIHIKAVGGVTETDTALGVMAVGRRTLGQASETEAANPITRINRRLIGAVAETDAVQAMTHLRQDTIDRATEISTAQHVARQHKRTIGQLTETDTVTSIARRKVRIVNRVFESDVASTTTGAKQRTVHQTSEVDSVHSVKTVIFRTVNRVVETDLAQAVAHVRRATIGTVLEHDTAQAVGRLSRRAVGMVSEVDTARHVVYEHSGDEAGVSEFVLFF